MVPEGVCGWGGSGEKCCCAEPEKRLLAFCAIPRLSGSGVAACRKGQLRPAGPRGSVVGRWIWGEGYCPAWLRLAPVPIDTCVPLGHRLVDACVPPSCSQEGCKVLIVTLASLGHLSSKAPVITELKWGRGRWERGLWLKPWPHQQDYNLIKASTALVVFRDALPAPLNLGEGRWLSVPGTALP